MTSAADPVPDAIALNGQPAAGWADVCGALRGMLSRSGVAAAGGVLIKAATCDRELLLHVQPNFINGLRAYHHDLPLPADADAALTGHLDPNGRLALIPLSPAGLAEGRIDPASAKRLYAAVARALLDAGLPGRCPIAPASSAAIVETGIARCEPATLAQLADAVSPHSR
jgi:hypothetical protein